MFGLKPSDIEKIKQICANYVEVEEALIYGSRAMGNYKPGSDVDIALIGNVSLSTVFAISAELNERTLMPYKFDVLAYSHLTNMALKEHIDTFGKTFYTVV